MKNIQNALIATSLLLLQMSAAKSAPTVYTTASEWLSALGSASGSVSNLNFDVGLSSGSFVYASSFSADGVSVTGSFAFDNGYYTTNGLTFGSTSDPLFTFDKPTYAFGFNGSSYTRVPLLVSLDNGETLITNEATQTFFYGFISETPFSSLGVREYVSDNYVWSITGVATAAVPEPASFALFGAGLLGLGLAWGNRRGKAKPPAAQH